MGKAESEKSMIGGRVVLVNGETYKIVDETNVYWVCKGTQFLKSNPSIKKILPPKKKREEKENPDHPEVVQDEGKE